VTPVTFYCDPDGEYVDLMVQESSGMAAPLTVTIPTEEIERVYNTLRAAQLGADMQGNL
jgi:hypothetical protein